MNHSIQRMYSSLPGRYEMINHILTLGMDIVWRRRAVKMAAAGGGTRWLDLCAGTGETAVYLTGRRERGAAVYALDFSLPMMRRFVEKPASAGIHPGIARASALPFRNNTLDLVIITFATRNLNTPQDLLRRCYREIYRVLTPGGRFITLETSQPSNPFVRTMFHAYIRLVVAPVSRRLSGSDPAYRYLAGSMRRFMSADELAACMAEAGFRVAFNHLLLGAAAIHYAVKPDLRPAPETPETGWKPTA